MVRGVLPPAGPFFFRDKLEKSRVWIKSQVFFIPGLPGNRPLLGRSIGFVRLYSPVMLNDILVNRDIHSSTRDPFDLPDIFWKHLASGQFTAQKTACHP